MDKPRITRIDVPYWITEDGSRFDSEEAASAHSEALALARELLQLADRIDLDWQELGPLGLTKFLLTHYTLTRKES